MSEHSRSTRSPDKRADGYRTTHDWSDPKELTTSIVTAVADATGNDPLDLPNLQKAINPDALNSLFDHPSNATTVRIQFEYADCVIDVTGDGDISVYES